MSMTVNGVQECQSCNVTLCNNCSVIGVCTSCQVGSTLTNGVCQADFIKCLFPCTSCNQLTGVCEECLAPPFSLLPSSNGSCYYCYIFNCRHCSETDPAVCSICNKGFILDSSNTSRCVAISGCMNASNVTVGTCEVCSPLYALNTTTNMCVSCQVPQGCLTCDISNINVCTQCQMGLFLQNGTCFMCPDLCFSCDASGCLQFSPEVLTVNDKILLVGCPFPCKSCNGSDPFYCTDC